MDQVHQVLGPLPLLWETRMEFLDLGLGLPGQALAFAVTGEVKQWIDDLSPPPPPVYVFVCVCVSSCHSSAFKIRKYIYKRSECAKKTNSYM